MLYGRSHDRQMLLNLPEEVEGEWGIPEVLNL